MQFKPFKRPSFLSKPNPVPQQDDPTSPPAKKRRISDEKEFKRPVKAEAEVLPLSQNAPHFRRPLVSVKNSSQPDNATSNGGGEPRMVYSALWRKKTAKMHKTWDGDGTLVVVDGYASLKNEKGKYMGRTVCKTPLLPGSALSISGMDVEVEDVLSADPHAGGDDDRLPSPAPSSAPKPSFKAGPTLSVLPKKLPSELQNKIDQASQRAKQEAARKSSQIPAAKPSTHTAPLLAGRIASGGNTGPTAKHDPHAPGALVMQRPKTAPSGKTIVDVVVDPAICKHLREHQRAGVAFMYECIMGMRCKEGAGAILADEMGLGKSLQTIALLWTLLKQNPVYREGPIVRKAIVLCPASVTKNWRKEFRKWLGYERVGVLLLDDQKKIRSFTRGKSYQVLVVGYEMFNLVQKDLQKCNNIDIVIADEGHRLKTTKNKTTSAVTELDIEKRIVLTGTLLQNDYSEWYSVVDFVNPGFLGKYSLFKKNYENPILRSRQQGASPEDLEKGEEADQELKEQTSSFILRRTADILAKYLPAKTEYVVMCRPTKTQYEIYDSILSSGSLTAALRNSDNPFQMINILKKACNSVSLLAPNAISSKSSSDDSEAVNASILSELHATIPASKFRTPNSGKLRVLDSLLHHISKTTSEKVVIMSNYTSTLDIIAPFLTSMSYTFTRLDGSTPAAKRQDMVDSFNATPASRHFIFLMSTKAGGVGLNLIGASRLILYDVDWNPAVDLQAMGRICRDGQRRACWIYRLVTRGAIEERIFQRQVVKMGLADSVVDGRKGESSFSQEELRDLFTLDRGEGCRTHDLLGCDCGGEGRVVEMKDGEAEGEVDEGKGEGRKGFVSAALFDSEVRSREGSPVKRERRMRGLMLCGHVDAGKMREVSGNAEKQQDDGSGIEDDGSAKEDSEIEQKEWAIQDGLLRKVILESESSVDFVFAKTSENNTAKEVKEMIEVEQKGTYGREY
ncbi:DNA repair and recombination protein RDH54-like protein [Elsinoe fawcettii]|nr:DNA repair and recombination protein RDH54-like protein [Elsinoe fawcettii]